jgi:MAF protein
MKRLILASSSPRRYELLTATGLPFEVARPDIDETPHPDESPADYVLRLSREKALAVGKSAQGIIISADTTVVDNGAILGKPAATADAAVMLKKLRNRAHVVHTGVTVSDTETHHTSTRLTTSQVIMRNLTDTDIDAYVASGDPMGKAGSYAIQNTQHRPVAGLDGCYTNVVGLPLCTLCQLLKEHGVRVSNPVPCSPVNLPCRLGNVP